MKSKFLILGMLLPALILFLNGCSEDEGDDDNIFIGVYDADYNIVHPGGSGGGTLELTITASISGNANEIAIKNLTNDNKVYSATVSDKTFTIDSNSDQLTGSGTMQADGNTIHISYLTPDITSADLVATRR